MEAEGAKWTRTEKAADGFFQRSPFNFFRSQIPKKKPSAEKGGCEQYQGSDHEESKEESGKGSRGHKMNDSCLETQMAEQIFPAPDSMLCPQRVQNFLGKLGKQPSSKVLDLNNCALSTTDIMDLVAIIHLLPSLEEIDLSWNDLIGGTLKSLTLPFKCLQELKVLRLNNCRLTAMDLSFLGEALEVIPYLETLDLSWNNNIGGKLFLLIQNIPKDHKLKTLKVMDCSLTSEDGESLAQQLYKIHSLEVLDLSINKKIGYGLESIAQELKHVSGLKVLNLNRCGLKLDGFKHLASALQHLMELRELDLSCNKEIGGGFKYLAAHLAELKNLEILNLHQCCITEEDMTVLTQKYLWLSRCCWTTNPLISECSLAMFACDVSWSPTISRGPHVYYNAAVLSFDLFAAHIIPLLSSLQDLDLSLNKSIGKSSDHLLSRLRFLPKLKSVLLGNCSLQHNSFASLADAALHLPELELLDLSWNKCVGGNLKLILKALNLGAEIKVLRLSSCSLVDEDLGGLGLVIQAGHLAQLQELDLSYNNQISDQGWAVFYQDIVGLEQLSELDVSRRPSSRGNCGEWLGKLLAALLKLPRFTELGLQGWVLSEVQQKQLEHFNRDNERNVRFDVWYGA
ncbi:leucine-rich repeat-containing protein 31 isoform X1 [Zootoca vivipara]|uniref:leucine-rich repeat-containing protein 31 isoform X1 n=1 Tax=Zootoca vivipara TaxID=8524 RepID=UPI0015910930|nr:leucine-rich repeat-containing protein 31 isoform X1 [Zootoca vivipara]